MTQSTQPAPSASTPQKPLGRRPRAIALMSGGLDSALAAKIVKDQNVEVIGLHLISPFGCKTEVQKTADQIGIPMLFLEKGESYLDLVKSPEFGYGRAINPCIDCRIFMFELAEKIRLEQDADFIVTGEVLGQRPMSQQKHAMELIDRKSQMEDLVLRPLSAHLFPETRAEREGWVNRDAFFEISGRSRKEQMQMAKDLGLTEYANPGGGCLLTETSFAERLRDFFGHETHRTSEERMAQSQMLRLGRHFRLNDETKFIVGRNEHENRELEGLYQKANTVLFGPDSFDGPVVIGVGKITDEEKVWAGRLMCRYGKSQPGPVNRIRVLSNNQETTFLSDKDLSEEWLGKHRL